MNIPIALPWNPILENRYRQKNEEVQDGTLLQSYPCSRYWGADCGGVPFLSGTIIISKALIDKLIKSSMGSI
jgi:hypothetical protein